MAVMAIADTARFSLERARGRRFGTRHGDARRRAPADRHEARALDQGRWIRDGAAGSP